MADISTETGIITNETGGEEVRDAIVDACRKVAAELLPVVSADDYDAILTVNGEGEWAAVKRYTLSSITVATMPSKVSYVEGEELDLSGVVINATYLTYRGVSKTIDVTDDSTFSPADGDTLSVVGEQIVSVSFTEGGTTKTTSFVVAVEAEAEEETEE